MKLADFSGNFPKEQARWPHLQLSKALPVLLREVLYSKIGSLFASNDTSRMKSSSRLGLSLRPFQPGDRIKAISLAHLMRTDEIMTRIDNAQGQLTARIFCITSPSLDYKNETAVCTKGQVMLGVAAILEAMHLRQNHRVSMVFSPREEFARRLEQSSKYRQGSEAIYVLSDFLNGSLIEDYECMLHSGYSFPRCNPQFFCIRDRFEEADLENPLRDSSLELTDFVSFSSEKAQSGSSNEARNLRESSGANTSPLGQHFSGVSYVENLVAEMKSYRNFLRNHHCTLQNIEESTALFTVVKTLRDADLRLRKRI